MKLVEKLYQNAKNTYNTVNSNPIAPGKLIINYINSIKDAATGGFDDYSKTTNTNTIKELTSEERAKLKSKGYNPNSIMSTEQSIAQRFGADTGETLDVTPEVVLDIVLLGKTSAAKKSMQSTAEVIAKEYNKIKQSQGLQAAKKFLSNRTAEMRNNLVKSNSTAAKSVEEAKSTFQNKVEKALMASEDDIEKYFGKETADAYRNRISQNAMEELGNMNLEIAENIVNKAAKNPANLTAKEEESFISLIKENARGLGELAQEAGVKSKKDLPNFIKFVKDLGNILENSPLNIRTNAKTKAGLDLASQAYNVGMSGLSLYDLWNEYQQFGGTDFVPTLAANAGRLGGTFLSKNLAFKILMSQLGYTGGDKLSRYSLRKLGFNNTLSSKEAEEMKQGYRQPGMSEQLKELGEYFTGSSGRKYHVVNDKVYAFDTGGMVNINQFLNDINTLQAQKLQQTQDQLNNIQEQKKDIQQAIQSGYEIPPETITELDNKENQLLEQIKDITDYNKKFQITDDYNDEDDIVEQVYKNEVETDQQLQDVNNARNQQQAAQNLQDIYNILENQYKVNIDNYFTPENLAMDYYQYMEQAVQGRAQYLTPEQFTNIQKAKALYQVIPQIRSQAISEYNTMYGLAQKDTELGIKDKTQQETARNNYVTNLINQYKAQETARHNVTSENINQFNAKINEKNAQTRQQQTAIQAENAVTNKQRAEAYQQYVNQQGQLVGPKQFEMMGSGLAGGVMGGLTADQMLNVNPELGKQLFPGAFQEAEVQQEQQIRPQTQKQSQFTQNKNIIQGLLGN